MFLLPFGRHLRRQSLLPSVRLVMFNYDHFMVATMTTMVNDDNLLFGVQRR